MKLLNLTNKVIEYSFYLIFFLVPLALTGDTSELFEFNKLWLTYILTIIIATAWISKMIIKKEFKITKTPLDIPIGLFVLSQILSTIFSTDMHISIWGYYSRFNGGLLSILSYVFLYYAFISNYKDLNTEKQNNKFPNLLFFISAVIIFFTGTFISSLIKVTEFSLIPYQMLATLVTAISAFIVFMKSAPSGFLKRSIYTLLTAGLLVVLWAIPSHFGFDPTCLLFRGTLDVSCWTADFQPKVRVFATLGQPAWLSAYLVILIPVIIALFLNFVKNRKINIKKFENLKSENFIVSIALLSFIAMTYVTLLYTKARSGIMAIWIISLIFIAYYLWVYVKPNLSQKLSAPGLKAIILIGIIFYFLNFTSGQPFQFLRPFTLEDFKNSLLQPKTNTSNSPVSQTTPVPDQQPAAPTTELGGTDSGTIRKYVWEGAVSIWKNYPIFGSGLETYAFAYYKERPVGHNQTSEWKFLYNKAHNEYLNYLATTGTFGIITYLSMIGMFIFIAVKFAIKNHKKPNSSDLLALSFFAGYSTILLTNFLGFSVVMVNILFYLLPAFFLIQTGLVNFDKNYGFNSQTANEKEKIITLANPQKTVLGIVVLISVFLIYQLLVMWTADRYYYLGYNFNQGGNIQTAYTFLEKAVKTRPGEPVFRNEFSLNNAILAAALIYENQQKQDQQNLALANQLVESAVTNSNKLIQDFPNNVVFWKTRVRIFYTLAQVNGSYIPQALEAVKKAAALAPTDPDVSYNLGVLYGETGDFKKGIEILDNTIKLKPDYNGGVAYYAKGIFYHQLAVNEKGTVVNQDYLNKAIEQMEYLIKTFGPNEAAQSALDTWKK